MASPPHQLALRNTKNSCGARGGRKSRLRRWGECFGLCHRHSPSSDVQEPSTENFDNMQPLGDVEEPLQDSHEDEPSVELQVQQFTLKEQEFPSLTIDDVRKLLDLVTAQVASTGGSQSNSNELLTHNLSQYEERKETLTSFIKSLPSDLKKKVIGGSTDVLMPLLTSALGGAGNVHWVGIGLRLIAWSLESMHDTMQNKQDCLEILRDVVDFMRSLLAIWEKTTDEYKNTTNPTLQKIVEIAFSCAVICTITMNDPSILRYIGAKQAKDTINTLKKDLGRAKADALFYMSKWQMCEQPKIPQQMRIERDSYDAQKVGGDEVKLAAMEFLSVDSNDMIAVCLHGMGGIGKSFTGLEIFIEFPNRFSMQHKLCRVELELDIGDEKLVDIQKDILRNLYGSEASTNVSDCVEGRSKLIQEMKKTRDPVFLYLDNVLEYDHLEKLLPKSSCFPKGSKLLVTSRGADILGGIKALGIKVFKLVEITVLQDKEAKELLWKQMSEEREKVIVNNSGPLQALEEGVLKLCGGLPLALTVVGGCIANDERGPTDARVWKEVVEAMEKAEPLTGRNRDPLYTRIAYSIECLDPNVKRSFLDIVSFFDPYFNNEWKVIKRMVGHRHLKVLQQCNLVQKTHRFGYVPTVPSSGIKIHDVLYTLARKMVENDTDELRIEGTDNFNQLTGDDLRKVVSLKQVELNASMLTQMQHLRVLKSVHVQGECEKPAQLCKLSVVDFITHSGTSKLLNLGGCACLKHMKWETHNASDLEVLRNEKVSATLELLDLSSGDNLENVDAVETLKSLKRLHLDKCPKISRLPQGIGSLTNLKQLSLTDSSGLAALPEGMTRLTGLKILDLSGCHGLKMLPERIGNLTRLTYLYMRGCSAITHLPDEIGGLERLEKCEGLQCLPGGSSGLTRLQVVDLTDSNQLECLPEAPGVDGLKSLKRLMMRGCSRLGCLPRGIASMTSLETLELRDCTSLVWLPEELASLSSLQSLGLSDCKSLECLPLALPASLPDLSVSLAGCTGLLTFTTMEDQGTNLTWAKVSYLSDRHPTLFQARSEATSP